jgi:ABC-2 type transport system ATP-binding protein
LGLTWKANAAAIRKRIGISLQETRLSDKLTVAETLRLFRSFYSSGLTVDQAIDRVSLGEKRHARVEKLSGGQKQRLAVACALVGDPELLFLDEPTTGLDPQSRRQLWDVIGQFRQTGRTVVLTTHYMDEAERLCDRVAIVDHGKIIALGTPRELIAQLQAEHVILLTLEGADPPKVEELARLPSVRSVRHDNEEWSLSVALPHVALPALLDYLKATSRDLATLTTRHATLEDVFVGLTGRHLRDDDEVRP